MGNLICIEVDQKRNAKRKSELGFVEAFLEKPFLNYARI
jgi:hypothetical protein